MFLFYIKSNEISRFAKTPHHQSSGAPKIMTYIYIYTYIVETRTLCRLVLGVN